MTLNPKQFTLKDDPVVYHADDHLDVSRGTHGTSTRTGMTAGEIVPASVHGGYQAFPDLSDSSRAYYTAETRPEGPAAGSDADYRDTSQQGWNWARKSQMNRTIGGARARQVVHHVEPIGTIDVDRNINEGGNATQMTADRLRITDTEWIPKASEDSAGVQGTLPHENWNKYPKSDSRYSRYGRSADLNQSYLDKVSPEQFHSNLEPPPAAPPTEMPGQLTMVDRPATWYEAGRKADI